MFQLQFSVKIEYELQ